ncbi:hypothetical protein OKW30_008029 [Paraburkholderia sp. Clong3]
MDHADNDAFPAASSVPRGALFSPVPRSRPVRCDFYQHIAWFKFAVGQTDDRNGRNSRNVIDPRRYRALAVDGSEAKCIGVDQDIYCVAAQNRPDYVPGSELWRHGNPIMDRRVLTVTTQSRKTLIVCWRGAMLRIAHQQDSTTLGREGSYAMRLRRITARHSPVHGMGLFALHPIAAGEKVIEYKGEVTSWRRADTPAPPPGSAPTPAIPSCLACPVDG